MADLLKSTDAAAKDLTRFAEDGFDEFPEAPTNLPGEEVPEEEEVDLEALREQVLAEAREEAERKVREAYEKGFAKGREAGEAEFRASVAECAAALHGAAAAMVEARSAFLAGLEPQVVDLVGLVAERVLAREGRTDGDLINSTVRRALAGLTDRQKLHVRVNPADLEALRTHKVTLLQDFGGIEELEVVADDAVTPGGCLVDTETLHVDATIETLLAEVLQALTDEA